MASKFHHICLLLLLVASGIALSRADWDDKEDESEENDYNDWNERGHDAILVCGNKNRPCTCQKGDNTTLLCVGQHLETANLYVGDKKIGPIVIAHLQRNQISYLFKKKILPGQEDSLLELDLSQNQIEDIQPGAFDLFENLLKLKLTHNNLDEKSLSQDIFTPELANLNQLYLDYNFLRQLDDGLFDNLKSLTKLVLDGNKELKISNKVLTSELANLEVLSLDRCNLAKLDIDLFINLPNLRALSLSGNPLENIPLAISPVNLPSLQALAMSDTRMVELNDGELQRAIPKLQKLYMRKNKYLKKIGHEAFAKLAQLEVLDFSDSSALAHFDKDAFGGSAPLNLKQVSLKNCNLSGLAEGTLDNVFWGTLHKLELGQNPWNCDCGLKWFVNNDQALRLSVQFEAPICDSPENLKGMSLYNAGQKIDCSPPGEGTSSVAKFTVFLVFMVMAASLVVFGVVYARRRYMLTGGSSWGAGNFGVPHFLGGSGPRIPQNQMGFNSGGRNMFDDDDDDNEEEEVEETGTAAHVPGAPRPEFV